MPFSNDTEHVLEFLQSACDGGLRKREDIGLLLELAAEMAAHEQINALAFHGKSLYALYAALRRTPGGQEGQELLEREFVAVSERFRAVLSEVMVNASAAEVERLDGLYYQMTRSSLRHLVDLAHDFGVLKSIQNDRKHA